MHPGANHYNNLLFIILEPKEVYTERDVAVRARSRKLRYHGTHFKKLLFERVLYTNILKGANRDWCTRIVKYLEFSYFFFILCYY